MSKITSVLWLGNQKNALSEAFLKKHHITHILCCAKDGEINDKYVHYKIPMVERYDTDPSIISKWLHWGADLVNKWTSEGIVLVHCIEGVDRSASIIIFYLMKYHKLSYKSAYSYVKQQRSIINPQPYFVSAMKIEIKKINNLY